MGNYQKDETEGAIGEPAGGVVTRELDEKGKRDLRLYEAPGGGNATNPLGPKIWTKNTAAQNSITL